MFVVIPDYIDEAINKLVDEQIEKHPVLEPDRGYLRSVILEHLDKTGELPETFEVKFND